MLPDAQVGEKEEPGDLMVASSRGRIFIQVAEAVDTFRVRLRAMRSDYGQAAAAALAPLSESLRGKRLSFSDDGGEPSLPKLKSNDGARILAEIVTHVENVLKSLEANLAAPGWSAYLDIQEPKKRVHMLLEKYSSINSWPQRAGKLKIPEDQHQVVSRTGAGGDGLAPMVSCMIPVRCAPPPCRSRHQRPRLCASFASRGVFCLG
jgi:hypothetical protein